ncbi:MAG: hypothetical protein CME64_16455 [Halobacteriovoraceae bacterium]|nr:hypothetical protein [Halobacteriovoraceae bacterium]
MLFLKHLNFLWPYLLCASFSVHSFEYKNREHSFKETAYRQGQVFVFHAVGYMLTQSDTIREDGSWEGYKRRFLDFQYDPDNSVWNLLGHPLTGAQVFLFYRAYGYTREKSFLLGALSSLYFETLIESYTERPSAQDTINTPIFGAMLGTGIERVSVELLNSNRKFYRAIGRIINPFSFLTNKNDFKAGIIPLRGGASVLGGWRFD